MMRVAVLLVLVGCAFFYTTDGVGMAGGLSDTIPADQRVKDVVRSVEPQIIKELGKPVPDSSVISYKTQIVSGTNYFVKVKTGNTEYAHLRIYQNFDGSSSLDGVQQGKGEEEEINYF